MPRPEILTFEEIERCTNLFVSLGVRKLRLTGGEPLVRKDLPKLIEKLRGIAEIEEVAMTTNAILMDKLADSLMSAGLDRINVSLDSVDREVYAQLTKRDELDKVFAGIAAAKTAGFKNIRLNAVAIAGLSENEVIPLTRYAFDEGLHLRFIEFMPLNAAGDWNDKDVLSGNDILRIVESEFGQLRAFKAVDKSQPATDFETSEGQNKIGFINSVTQPFCATCNRLRLTADGKMRNCLFGNTETDLRALLRSGAKDETIRAAMQQCVREKKRAHGIGDEDFAKPERAMYQIGG